MFIPATREEMQKQKWDQPDIILVTGDAYIDSPYMGISVIGQVLIDAGYRVGIIAQPDIHSKKDITRLGAPKLFWGVTAGCMDSMVANFTASKKRRNKDDLTPGGVNNLRPNRSSIVYTGLIRRFFKPPTVPIVLGGLEASLRRIAHYDHWSNSLRRSLLLDAKANLIVYGMGEKAVLALAYALKNQEDYKNIKGICYLSDYPKEGYLALPAWEKVTEKKDQFMEMFDRFYQNNDPGRARGLFQAYGNKYLICNPPMLPLTSQELDHVYDLPYERKLHPLDQIKGKVRAMETIRFSITTHRGCYGECHFCSIAVHQGNRVISRSEESILREVNRLLKDPDFKGVILDVGGPTANMYKTGCKKFPMGRCTKKRCLYPVICKHLRFNHRPLIRLLSRIRNKKNIKKVFVASGIRYDLIIADKQSGQEYLEQIVNHHTSGQLKIAPEHSLNDLLQLMGKPDNQSLEEFKRLFDRLNQETKKKQYLTYYFIAAHPGCSMKHMDHLRDFALKKLHLRPEQVQIFTPSPSTYSTLMFYTGINPFTREKIFVEREMGKMEKQKKHITHFGRRN